VWLKNLVSLADWAKLMECDRFKCDKLIFATVCFVPEAEVDKTVLNQLVIMTRTPLIG